jgi:hypothetical protein
MEGADPLCGGDAVASKEGKKCLVRISAGFCVASTRKFLYADKLITAGDTRLGLTLRDETGETF